VSKRAPGLTLLAALCLIVAAAPRAVQDWRGPALASFDEAWQTINDTYYDPKFGGVDWDAVKRELRPRAEAATSPDQVRAMIRDMVSRLGQSHFGLLSMASSADTLPGAAMPPIEIRVSPAGIVIERVTAGSQAERAGVRAGQVILAADDEPASAWIAPDEGRGQRARDLETWQRAFRAIHGNDGSSCELRVRESDGREHTIKVTRRMGAGETVQLGNLPPLQVLVDVHPVTSPAGRQIGFIGFNLWMTAIDAPVAAAVDRFRQADGLIFDLRGNPGGLALMITGFAGHLIADQVVLGTMQTRQASLQMKVNPRLVTPDGRRVTPFAGPVAILVDELTASASETLAGALQSLGRARIFGRQTMGQALPALTKRLPSGDVLMYGIGDFVTSTGRRLEGAGVVPDEQLPLSISALAAGHDEPLDAAVRWIDQQRAARASREGPK
jgi:carboxyl-terminal processing protease